MGLLSAACAGAPSLLNAGALASSVLPAAFLGMNRFLHRHYATANDRRSQSIYVVEATRGQGGGASPVLLGLFNMLSRQVETGFFGTVPAKPYNNSKTGLPRHVELIQSRFQLQGPAKDMIGCPLDEAQTLIGLGKKDELIDRIVHGYSTYKARNAFVLLYGGSRISTLDFDAQIASAVQAPMLLLVHAVEGDNYRDILNEIMRCRARIKEQKASLMGVIVNKVEKASLASMNSTLKHALEDEGIPFFGCIPLSPTLRELRVDEVVQSTGAECLAGDPSADMDKQVSRVVMGCENVSELLDVLRVYELQSPGQGSPIVLTSGDRSDTLLSLLAAHISPAGPHISAILAAGHHSVDPAVTNIFQGLAERSHLPLFQASAPLLKVAGDIARSEGAILPTSTQKTTESILTFDRYIDQDEIFAKISEPPKSDYVTSKMFQYNLFSKCKANLQRIVLPEANDARVLRAASQVKAQGLCVPVLLGKEQTIIAKAKQLAIDLDGVEIIDHEANNVLRERYVEALVEARKHKGMNAETARDLLRSVNTYGVMMVREGDADGMVSGAAHTTADTVRPALQLLTAKGTDGLPSLVSSIFFMLLPDKVLVYGDCAVNVNPTSEQLAQIGICSADTAKAFGIDPRVAMLSYATMGSNSGPQVSKVIDAVELIHKLRPDVHAEGPFQYDAAVDPSIAAMKIKGESKVAGRATVLTFPDLQSGNIGYKSVQQSNPEGIIAMGPVLQGLSKPVNDLSRGCTVRDIINTICVTAVQAIDAKARA
ncbi:unnamed protein product [Pedinophyceae sp. YPF-701]|nr:unnamed protein product [Pedinophyceae sp. YPF-701]